MEQSLPFLSLLSHWLLPSTVPAVQEQQENPLHPWNYCLQMLFLVTGSVLRGSADAWFARLAVNSQRTVASSVVCSETASLLCVTGWLEEVEDT
jgi:hypothetical protein